MKPTVLLLALATGLLLGACGGESKLPVATGKASITAINAIYGSPEMNFLIEERPIGQIRYQETTATASYDDLDYTFSFEVFFAGDLTLTRIASQHIDFVADQHYTIVAGGTITAPVLTVWDVAQRTFADTDTVFQTRFSHTSNTLSATTIDVYFALDGVVPVLGEAVATLNFGDLSDALDFEADDYVVTITTSGDPTDVLFTSRSTTLLARTNLVITPFDGDANNTSPLVVRGLGVLGGAVPFHDSSASSTVQFLHAAKEMGTSDVYDDAALSSQILASHAYRDLTADADIAVGSYEYFYTPAGDTTVVLLDTNLSVALGFHYRVTAIGSGGDYSTTNTILDRRSIDTAAKLLYFPSSNNFEFTDLYIVEAGTSIDEQTPFRAGAVSKTPGPSLEFAPGNYDVYITEFLDKAILAGPFPLNVALGDVVDMVVYDTDDTSVLDIVTYPLPP
jgi:hypothetical protein